jgi:hypothetical protein
MAASPKSCDGDINFTFYIQNTSSKSVEVNVDLCNPCKKGETYDGCINYPGGKSVVGAGKKVYFEFKTAKWGQYNSKTQVRALASKVVGEKLFGGAWLVKYEGSQLDKYSKGTGVIIDQALVDSWLK